MPHLPALPTRPLLLLALAACLPAVDGFAIHARTRGQCDDIQLSESVSLGLWRHDLVDGKVVKSSRLTAHPALFPVLSPDGTRVAFYRQNRSVDEKTGEQQGEGDETWRLSVMQVDGSGLRDLLPLEGKGFARLAWPIGDWIHYHRTSATQAVGTGQVWRVRLDDPRRQELMLDVNAANQDPKDPGRLFRYSLNMAGDRVGLRVLDGSYGGNDAYAKYPAQSVEEAQEATLKGRSLDRTKKRIQRCMIQLSPTGRILATFPTEAHHAIWVHRWDHATNTVHSPSEITFEELGASLGREAEGMRALGGGQYIRWSANSERWLTLQTNVGNSGRTFLIDWVAKTIIPLPGPGRPYSHCPGVFWVKGPVGSIEDEQGVWQPVKGFATAGR